MTATPNLLLNVDEAARMLRISKSYAKRLIASGKLPSVTIGRCRRVRLVDLERYVSGLTEVESRDTV